MKSTTHILTRIMRRVLVTSKGCWEYQGYRSKAGYGRIKYRPEISSRYKMVGVHRLMYEMAYGNIPIDTPHVLHKCDNPPCCNPKHLYLGNNFVNQQDAVRKKRHRNSRKKFCPKGHEYTEENTYLNKQKRYCLICKRFNC